MCIAVQPEDFRVSLSNALMREGSRNLWSCAQPTSFTTNEVSGATSDIDTIPALRACASSLQQRGGQRSTQAGYTGTSGGRKRRRRLGEEGRKGEPPLQQRKYPFPKLQHLSPSLPNVSTTGKWGGEAQATAVTALTTTLLFGHDAAQSPALAHEAPAVHQSTESHCSAAQPQQRLQTPGH
jgi:hypothetical protein